MKTNKILKVMLIILVITLLVLVGIIGIYAQDKNRLTNIVKDFSLGMGLGVERELVLAPRTDKQTNYYDANGKLVDKSSVTEENKKDYTEKEEPINLEEVLNLKNYKTSKQIIEKRLDDLGVQGYTISLDEESGNIVIRTLETDKLDNIVYALYGQGELIMQDSETGEVLLNNKDIKEAKVAYYNEQDGTRVYLTVQLNKEGTKKLEKISSEYISTVEEHDHEGAEHKESDYTKTKNVKLYIDKNLVVDTYFGEPIKDGAIQLSIGNATQDPAELQQYLMNAGAEATKLTFGNLPLVYKTNQNTVIFSSVTQDIINVVLSVLIIVATVIIAYLIIAYRERGIIASILFAGFVGLIALVVKYTNVYLNPESIFALSIMILFNLIFLDRVLRKLKKYDTSETTPKAIIDKSIIKSIFVLAPAFIVAVVFALISNMSINSFGIGIFWGVLLFVAYTYIITRTLLLNFEYLFEE